MSAAPSKTGLPVIDMSPLFSDRDAAARAELEWQAHAKRELRERMRPDSAARWMIPLLMVALLVLILWRD